MARTVQNYSNWCKIIEID